MSDACATDLSRTLHASVNLRALCDGRPLDPEFTSESPECRDLEPCRMCVLLVRHRPTAAKRRDGAVA